MRYASLCAVLLGGILVALAFPLSSPVRIGLALAGLGAVAALVAIHRLLSRNFTASLASLSEEKERVEKLEVARRDFLADVSHNLGTPLAAVLGWTDMLLGGVTTQAEERRQLLTRIQRDVQYVSRTVRQLLELSRWEAAPPQLLLESFPLVEPLMEVVETLSEAAAENGTQLSLEGVNPAYRVEADRLRVREVLQILLENVVAHAGPNVTAVVRMQADDTRVRITIQDNGIGITTRRLKRLHDRFHPSGGRGAGLGLSIAHRLVEAHGGKLDIDQLTVGGTEATFALKRT